MVNYYETLKVSPNASRAEIKTAYRRLARKLHPDKNNGSEETARAFAAIAEAWEVLGSPAERARYDKQLLKAQLSGTNGNSVFTSSNSHARRWRQLVYEHRYNEIIDRMIAEERRESAALQKIIFPVVALCLSTLMVAIFKPQFFSNSAIIGKIILISLFVAGVIHLFGRVREALDRYTYVDTSIHDSILDETLVPAKRYSRAAAGALLAAGVISSFFVGLFIGQYVEIVSVLEPGLFSRTLSPEFVFYPPIFVLLVDMVHTFAMQFDH